MRKRHQDDIVRIRTSSSSITHTPSSDIHNFPSMAYPSSSSSISSSRTRFTSFTAGAASSSAGNLNRSTSTKQQVRNKLIAFAVITALYTGFLYRSGGAKSFLSEESPAATSGRGSGSERSETMNGLSRMRNNGRTMTVATWNIAAINNNPFEYWLTMADNPDYEALMTSVEKFIESPEDNDIPVHKVFTDAMFDKLQTRMKAVGWSDVDIVRTEYWKKDYRNRKIVSQFLKDSLLGSKRLASMPDRVTNTINVAHSDMPACRPTVINMYEGDLSTIEQWYEVWEEFMFVHPLKILQKPKIKGAEATVESIIPYQMLQPILKAKYPDITEQEESISLPLQTLAISIFDAILVHMMNKVSPSPSVWQNLKKTIVQSLIKNKVKNTLQILEESYSSADIVTLQEVSSSFIYEAASTTSLGKYFYVISPSNMDASRDQNSIIFLNKKTFPEGASSEITSLVESSFDPDVSVPIAKGDLLAVTGNYFVQDVYNFSQNDFLHLSFT
jgi:hypothetical protein